MQSIRICLHIGPLCVAWSFLSRLRSCEKVSSFIRKVINILFTLRGEKKWGSLGLSCPEGSENQISRGQFGMDWKNSSLTSSNENDQASSWETGPQTLVWGGAEGWRVVCFLEERSRL